MALSREQHLQWCKKRALEYVERGQLQQAITSMMSDMNKHSRTAGTIHPALFIIGASDARDPAKVRAWIEGFN